MQGEIAGISHMGPKDVVRWTKPNGTCDMVGISSTYMYIMIRTILCMCVYTYSLLALCT